MRYKFYTADVFTEQLFGGNQLAVFPDAQGLTTEQMQNIAREFNLSETVFVFPPEDPEHTRRLRIFTPATELPFAGHPTIGCAHVLAEIGEISVAGDRIPIVFEEGVGPIPVTVFTKDGKPLRTRLTAAVPPEYGPQPPSIDSIASMLSLDPADLLSGADAPEGKYAPEAVSCGVPFLFVPVRTMAALQHIRVDVRRWQEVLASYWAPHLFVFVPGPTESALAERGVAARARMFAPAMSIAEDPATGAAATAFAAYLGKRESIETGELRWIVEQGFEMGRPSILEIEADIRHGDVVAVRVGGASVMVSEGTMRVS